MKYKKIEITKDNWSSIHDLENHIPLELTLNDKKNAVKLIGIDLDELSETTSLPQKSIYHELMDLEAYTVDTKSIIPFGAEPVITRKFEYLPNIIKITTDVHIKRPISTKKFEIDSLELNGKWVKYALIDIESYQKNKQNNSNSKIEWIDISSIKNKLLYQNKKHFHVLLLEDKDEMRIEIGVGFDLWRWNFADNSSVEITNDKPSKFNNEPTIADSEGDFSIEKLDDLITIKRVIIKSDELFDIPAHNWRFHWYLSWGQKESINKKETTELHLEKEVTNITCLHNKSSKNIINKAIRSAMNKLETETLELKSISPHYCSNPSHVSRPALKEVEHLDITDIFELWLWANKQLQKRGKDFIVTTPANSIYNEFPSFWQMEKNYPSKK